MDGRTGDWSPPEVTDYGDLVELTAAAGVLGSEDGSGKAINIAIDPIIGVTAQVLP